MQNQSSLKNKMEETNSKFLTSKIKFWKNRFSLKSYRILLIFASLFILKFLSWHFLLFEGRGFILDPSWWVTDSMSTIIIIFALYIPSKIPKKFEALITANKAIFQSEDSYEKYKMYVKKVFGSKFEFFFPLICGIIYSFSYLISINIIYFYGVYRVYLVINRITGAIFYFMEITLAASALLILIFTFKCLNKLGTEQFPLNVTYMDLKIGAFQKIGKFLISMIIPPILLCTTFSIYGMMIIYTWKNLFVAFAFMGIGLTLTCILTCLLYKNTIHIHNSILKYKAVLKQKTIEAIQKEINKDNINYKQIEEMHNFYKEVLDIKDWPFNPASVKKLAITLSSSVVPLIFSLFGLVGL